MKRILFVNYCTCLLITALVASSVAHSGEPPFPDDLSYPSVISPESQFGSFGQKLGLMNTPRGVSYNSEENIFCVADTLNNRILVLDQFGNPVDRNSNLIASTEFSSPHAVDCTNIKFVAVADTANRRITIVKDEKILWHIDEMPSNAKLVDIEVSNNLIFALDNANDSVLVYSKSGELKRTIDGFDSFAGLPLNNPLGLALDDELNIYISDSDNSRIVKLDDEGEFIRSWGTWGSYSSNLAGPAGITMQNNRLFVADQINHRVQVFDKKGEFLFQWGRHPSVKHAGNGRLHYPFAIAAYNNGENAVICEPIEHRCQTFAVAEAERLGAVNDSAWWNKATKFHYGTSSSPTKSKSYYSKAGFDVGPAINAFSIKEEFMYYS